MRKLLTLAVLFLVLVALAAPARKAQAAGDACTRAHARTTCCTCSAESGNTTAAGVCRKWGSASHS